MIPRKIQLKNFLSYGSDIQTVDFSTYPLICLSGKNGHGKSALLDAITWAVWGCARKVADVSKADEGLLRLGQTQMLVTLDFEFNGNTYRVRREFAKSHGKAHAALDFGLINADNILIPLTEKTIRGTQAKIEAMLNLDAESFINSAFLRQGQSNEFSKKSSKDRKEILASILGIARYETIRKSALEKAKQATADKSALLTLQTSIERDLAAKAELTAQLGAVTQQFAQLSTQESELANNHALFEKERSALAEKKQELKLLQFQQEKTIQEEEQQLTHLRTTRSAWRTAHSHYLNLGDQSALEEEKQRLLLAIAEHQKALQRNLEIKTNVLSIKETAQTEAQKITQAHRALVQSKQLAVERLAFETTTQAQQLATLNKEQAAREEEKKVLLQEDVTLRQKKSTTTGAPQLQAFEAQFEKRKEYFQKFMAQGTWTKNELASLDQKKNLVHDDDNPSCPLCEQNLTASRKRFLKTAFAKQEQFLTHSINRLARVVKKLKALLIEQNEQLTILRNHAEEQRLALIKLEELAKLIAKLKQACQEQTAIIAQLEQECAKKSALLTEEKNELDKLIEQEQHLLTKNSEYQTLVATMVQLEQESKATYDAQAHQLASSQLTTIEKQLAAYTHAREQQAQQKQRMQSIKEICTKLKHLRTQKNKLVDDIRRYAALAEQAQNLAQTEKQLIAQAQAIASQKQQLFEQKGRLESLQVTLLNLEKEQKKNGESIAELTATIDDFQAIATATGKDGIQALLIEDAIPEIEHEANQLLAKLTNNQSHMIIESLRDLKKGGTKETLDIKISDAVGIRPYEMFSGGEAFRIDFALRIAISKLLARRAGTSLQTLIIDEGFGSQDEDGLAHIMDAIYKIQDDFAKVIIVSHLPAMKDQFPVHFVVEKGPNGSLVKVVEQG